MRRLAVSNESVFGGLLRGVMGQQVTVDMHEEKVETEKESLARGPALKNLSRPKVEWGLIWSPAH